MLSVSPTLNPSPPSSADDSKKFSDREYITLVSAEKFEFVISKKAASVSKYLLELIADNESCPFGSSDKINLVDISTDVLEIVCQFL